ncbi:MAG: FtsX-like permease family protein, partial [Blastocatellia bacterium]
NTPPVFYRSSDQSAVDQAQALGTQMSVVIRTAAKPEAISREAIAEVRQLDPQLPAPATSTMDKIVAQSLAQPEFRAVLALIFAGVALSLAALGIYGVLSHAVAERTHEIGIRMALGASRTDVLKMVLGQGLALAVGGTAAGLCGAIAATRLVASLLFGVHPNDPVTLAAVTLFLATIALAACYIPAHRATRVDPSTALRYE